MEYFRSESQNTDVDNKANAAKVVWIKVLGEDIKKYVCFSLKIIFFSERKGMPLAVALFVAGYALTAISFFFAEG